MEKLAGGICILAALTVHIVRRSSVRSEAVQTDIVIGNELGDDCVKLAIGENDHASIRPVLTRSRFFMLLNSASVIGFLRQIEQRSFGDDTTQSRQA